MKKIIRIFVKTIIYLSILVIIIIASFFGYLTITDYKPEKMEEVKIINGGNCKTISDQEVFSCLIWNIGYCGLGSEMDFFYDGGKNVNTPDESIDKYSLLIKNTIKQYEISDFIMLQELDLNSKRSGFSYQLDLISEELSNHSYGHAINYDVKYIPFPFHNPMGKVKSGIATFSKHKAVSMNRYSFPVNYKWPKRIFFLDRCFLLSRYKILDKELVIINTHNSAFDNGSLREKEMSTLKNIMIEEYSKGNYVIAGGDWNQNPPGFNIDDMDNKEAKRYIYPPINVDVFPKEWNWVYDTKLPTNRNLDEVYVQGRTKTTIIDFYILSPNLKIVSCETLSTSFQQSDHQPVYLKFKIINDIVKK